MTKATQEGRVRFGFTVAEGQESFTITEQKPGTKHQAWWQRQQLKTHTENHKQETERAALENSKPTAVTTSSSKATPPQPWQAGRPNWWPNIQNPETMMDISFEALHLMDKKHQMMFYEILGRNLQARRKTPPIAIIGIDIVNVENLPLLFIAPTIR